jgi:hypothetical protein
VYVMKYKHIITLATIFAHAAALFVVRAETTNENNASVQRIGVYDSRVVAYAHFCTSEHQQWLKEKANAAKAAKAAGDQAQFDKLSKEMADEQRRIHREGFSTAPADQAMAALKPRLPEIQKQASVSVLVSKWDKEKLGTFKSAQQVDVTDMLVAEFKLDPKQLNTVEAIKKQKPVPLDKIDKMQDD